MRAVRRLLRDRRGATAVEFALVAGPLILLLLGTIEFARLLWYRQALEETATVGARCMGIPQPQCMAGGAYDAGAARSFILSEAAAWGLAVTPDDLTTDRAASCSGLPGFSTVSLNYTFQSAVPILFEALGAGPTLKANVCFPNQGG